MIILRAFHAEDIPFIKDVLAEVQERYQCHLPGYIEALSKYVERKDFTPFGHIRIIECNQVPVGWLGEKELSHNRFYLAHFYLLERFQNQGLGTHILQYYMQTLKHLNIKELEVDAHKAMSDVQHFYRKMGFRLTASSHPLTETTLKNHFERLSKALP